MGLGVLFEVKEQEVIRKGTKGAFEPVNLKQRVLSTLLEKDFTFPQKQKDTNFWQGREII